METFSDKQLFVLDTSNIPWYANFVNFLSHNVYPPDLSWQQKKKFLADVKHYYWDEPFLYKLCPDQILRRCVSKDEAQDILHHCHASEYGGHFGANRTATKTL